MGGVRFRQVARKTRTPYPATTIGPAAEWFRRVRCLLLCSVGVLLLTTLAPAGAFAAGPSPVQFQEIKNVPGRDACLSLVKLGRTTYQLAVFRSNGSAATRLVMWKGVLGLGETRMVAGDFDGNTLTDAMVIIH